MIIYQDNASFILGVGKLQTRGRKAALIMSVSLEQFMFLTSTILLPLNLIK